MTERGLLLPKALKQSTPCNETQILTELKDSYAITGKSGEANSELTWPHPDSSKSVTKSRQITLQ